MLKKNFLHARSPSLRPIPLQGTKHHVPFSQSLLIARRRLGGPRQHWGGRLEGCCSGPTQVRTSKFLLIPSTSLQLYRGKRHYPALFFSSIPSSSFHTRDLRALPFPFVALIIRPWSPLLAACSRALRRLFLAARGPSGDQPRVTGMAVRHVSP